VSDLLTVTGLSFAVAAGAMTVTALASRRAGRVSVVDVTWGVALVLVAGVAAALEPSWRTLLLLGLVTAWGGRLSWHIYRRQRGHGEDPRYAKILDGGGFGTAVRKVFLVQGVAIWFVSWPLQAAAVDDLDWPVLVGVGAAVWLLGVVFESVGDAQLAAYKRDPDRPPVMDRGLWGWTRHPNYFGDACVWWGLWLAGGLSGGWLPGLVTLAAPVVMTYFLVYATGARLLEETMMQRPGYPEYAARTSMFVPRPPRRGARRAVPG
jgi:steroid 5-alpha reductase family enzyme